MREEEIAAAIQTLHDGLVRLVAALVTEADQVQGRGCGKFKARVITHPLGELLRQLHVLPNVVLQTLDAIMADHEPQLQRAEPPPELNVPISIVDYGARFRGLIAQVFRQNT